MRPRFRARRDTLTENRVAPRQGAVLLERLLVLVPCTGFAGIRVLRKLEVWAVLPLLRQRGRRREIHRILDGDLVAQVHFVRSQSESLDGVLGGAGRYACTEAG